MAMAMTMAMAMVMAMAMAMAMAKYHILFLNTRAKSIHLSNLLENLPQRFA